MIDVLFYFADTGLYKLALVREWALHKLLGRYLP
jgi:hypothetical protein